MTVRQSGGLVARRACSRCSARGGCRKASGRGGEQAVRRRRRTAVLGNREVGVGASCSHKRAHGKAPAHTWCRRAPPGLLSKGVCRSHSKGICRSHSKGTWRSADTSRGAGPLGLARRGSRPGPPNRGPRRAEAARRAALPAPRSEVRYAAACLPGFVGGACKDRWVRGRAGGGVWPQRVMSNQASICMALALA